MAQKWREGRRPAPPLDRERLERLALRYVERYSTTRAKLTAYLVRKVRERGWVEDDPPATEELVERLAELRYVDDAAFAIARTASLMRRGYGPRRVTADLRAAGVGDQHQDSEVAERWEAALAFARRKRIGPFAAEQADRIGRDKAFAALMRAGHEVGIAKRILKAAPGEIPTWDDD